MITAAENREAVEAILRDDVYYADGISDYELRTFMAGKIAKNFSSYEGK